MQNQITPQLRRQLAVAHGLNEQYLYQCLTGRRDLDHGKARRIEAESGGVLTRQMLCQKTWFDVWPELAETTQPIQPAAHAQPAHAAGVSNEVA